MVKLFCSIVGVAGSAFSVEVDEGKTVDDLKEAIKAKKANDFKEVDADKLQLFLAKKDEGRGPWLTEEEVKKDVIDTTGLKLLGAARARLRRVGLSDVDVGGVDEDEEVEGRGPVNVLVVVPEGAVGSALSQPANSATIPNIAWYGTRGSIVEGEGIDLKDPRTLSRATLTADIIRRLEETHVLLVKSPPMTGKTSLATLVSRSLVDRHTIDNKKMVLFNLSALSTHENETFEENFKKQCEMDWKNAVATLPTQAKCMVYLVVDEVQVIYKEGTHSPRRKSTVFWELIKYVLSNGNYSIRILMFAAYGSGVEYTRLATPIQFDDRIVLGIDQLNFSHAEVSEYVQKWFKGTTSFGGLSSSAMKEFCANLEEVTGRHIGLCATTISELNRVHASRNRSASRQPLPAEWIRMLQSGSLYEANDEALFKALTSTRAVKVLDTLDENELDRLERIAYGANSDFDTDIVEQCLRKGILVQTERRFEFSSPVMWRFFVKMRVGHIVRALHVPKTLPEMVARVMRSIDYDSIRQTLGRSLSSDIPLERAWQMEFYKAAYHCTPSTFATSVDVGALFGSSGFVDFTIHGGDIFWGIELLREASNLAEHIKRFSPGGRYSSLPLTAFCLIDFRRVASIDDVPIERIAENMRDCDKLFVVCYDARMEGVMVINSAMDVVYRTQS
ncbi:Crinkler (CRN) family protein [Phytophthora infestans T30-4]|uniref:Crinkler (CRN) family protein n=1 Tax=Phytophthora infestans (strain T30-4) TaxID=403677 RepID=D0NUT5_PHYIT|nr:Crinkler (CRN) family protein [Phytophthora infestans T30-4]EEY65446.1 Crinkler (CRN) family protein [Phytophthora infestans T30-4]|eukprot:XP_002897164.1 Crinkler (CRN) family protein [Phytophthora infestans T30-4]